MDVTGGPKASADVESTMPATRTSKRGKPARSSRRLRGKRTRTTMPASGAGVGAGAGASEAVPGAHTRPGKKPRVTSKAWTPGPVAPKAPVGTATGSATARPAGAHSAAFKCVVKVYASMCQPNYSMPWQMRRQTESTASGFVLSERRILTNAHAVMHYSAVQVRKHGSPDKVDARVVAIGHDSDTALLAVDDESFWAGLGHLELGELPELQERVTVVGYPTGGDNISVTAGVVSRVDLHRYSLSYVSLLAIQIDAAINSGNSGGPAFDHTGKVVGIAFETLADAENIGYIIPVPVVQHFLDDVERDTKPRIGFGRLGFQWQALENKHLRKHLKLKAADSGVVVTKVLPLSSLKNKLKKHDVVAAIDGLPIANDGTVAFRNSERIQFRYHTTLKLFGEEMELLVLRNGRKRTIRCQVIDIPPLVPQTLYNKRPSYFVHAGMVFTVLSEPMLQADYSRHWSMKAPVRFVHMALNAHRKCSDEQVVILTMLLAHPINVGYSPLSFKKLQVLRVNGVRVRNLAHLVFLVEQLRSSHIQVDLSGHKSLVLDRKAAVRATPEVLHLHNIARDRSADVDEVLAAKVTRVKRGKAVFALAKGGGSDDDDDDSGDDLDVTAAGEDSDSGYPKDSDASDASGADSD